MGYQASLLFPKPYEHKLGQIYSRNLQQSIETEGSLPCSEELATDPDCELDESSPQPHILLLCTPVNIILPSIFRYSYSAYRLTNCKFTNAVLKLEADPACQRFSLQTFLTLPMQRVTRLPMLVEAIIRRLPSNNTEHRVWSETLVQLQKVRNIQLLQDGV